MSAAYTTALPVITVKPAISLCPPNQDLADLDLHRHLDFLTRAWKLRENTTAYDATYVALAEALDAPIVTCDVPLSRASGIVRRSK